MLLNNLIFFLTIFVFQEEVLAEPQRLRTLRYEAIRNKRKIGTPSTQISTTVQYCSHLCFRSNECDGFSYSTTLRLCEQHNCHYNGSGSVMEDSDWMYFEPSDGSCPVYPLNCKLYADYGFSTGDGNYIVKPKIGPETINLYCDMTSNGGGWTRLYYKSGVRTCTPELSWTEDLVKTLGVDKATDFGVSSSLTTLSTDQSWTLSGMSWGKSVNVDLLTVMTSVFNCQTPTGTAWSDSYSSGYLYSSSGTLGTHGAWTTMFWGCSSNKNVGDVATFRLGGAPNHGGEFVHSSCADYRVGSDNTVTCRWQNSCSRSMWFR